MNKIRIRYSKSPELTRMVIIAIIGALIGLITYEIIYYINPFTPKATLSWSFAFLIGVVRQHALHRRFTFLYKTPYWKSLYRAYVLDSVDLLLGSLLNWFLTVILHLNHRLAWVCCLLLTALISLFFLKKYVFKATMNQKLESEQN